MNINEAFEVLGLDLKAFLEAMNSKSSRHRKDVVQSYLSLAEIHKKSLLVMFHPDHGGDSIKFIQVQKAFEFIVEQSRIATEKLDYKMDLESISKVKLEIN